MIKLLTEKDRHIVTEYLERNHIECTFLIGNVNFYGIDNNKEQRRCADYFGYFEGSDLLGILPFYNLGSCIPHFESKAAAAEFVDIIRVKDIKYMLGMEKLITPIYEGIKDYKTISEYSHDSYYINDNFIPYNLPDVKIADAADLDLDAVLNFMVEARKKGFGEIRTKEYMEVILKQRAGDEEFLFLVKDGRIVAHANIQTTTSRINQIGGVYTSENERGKGYCKAVVSRLCGIITSRSKTPR